MNALECTCRPGLPRCAAPVHRDLGPVTSKNRVSAERLAELVAESRIRRMTAISSESEREWLDVHHSLIELTERRTEVLKLESHIVDVYNAQERQQSETKPEPACTRVTSVLDFKVTVCSECMQASCWLGEFYCEKYREAGTVEKTVRELHALGPTEDPGYWFKSPSSGKVNQRFREAYESAVKSGADPFSDLLREDV